jgi:hypothetical protein
MRLMISTAAARLEDAQVGEQPVHEGGAVAGLKADF